MNTKIKLKKILNSKCHLYQIFSKHQSSNMNILIRNLKQVLQCWLRTKNRVVEDINT